MTGLPMGLHREARRLGELGVAGYTRRMLTNPLIAIGNRVREPRYHCPCCGWRGARFFGYFGHGYTIANMVCPGCGSQPRHRGLHSLITREIARLAPGGRILHLAPEHALESVFAAHPGLRRIRTDLRMRAVDVRADATRMPFAAASFALVIASHLLEHIRDDHAVLAEMARVTAPEGRAIVAVPMFPDWQVRPTEEYPAPNPQVDDHWRTYGGDLAGRIERAGFSCAPVEFQDMVAAAEFESFGMRPGVVFIAGKPSGSPVS